MLNLNFINFTYIVDLSLLSLIDYIDSVEHNLIISDKNQIYLDFSKKQKDLLTSFIIENLLHAWQYGKKNIVCATCKPALNWRQSERNNGALKVYKYKLKDNSVYIDLIKLNQFLDILFNKLQKINLNDLKYSGILKSQDILKYNSYKNNLIFLSYENIDVYDFSILCKIIFENIGYYSYINSPCNIIQDGNDEYIHTNNISNNYLVDIIKQKLQDCNVL